MPARSPYYLAFITLSQKHGFLTIYPQSIDKHWNDGRKSEKFREHHEKVNDVAWRDALIPEFKRTYSFDNNRIYATGISNGGIFAQRLAIELRKHFAAVASLTAQIAEPLAQATPSNSISVLIMNATRDPLVPYEAIEVTPTLFPRFSKNSEEAEAESSQPMKRLSSGSSIMPSIP